MQAENCFLGVQDIFKECLNNVSRFLGQQSLRLLIDRPDFKKDLGHHMVVFSAVISHQNTFCHARIYTFKSSVST